MTPKTPFFLFFLLLIISFPNGSADTATAIMLPEGQTVIEETITLDNNTTLDVSDNVENIPTETQTVGGQTVELKEGYTFNTNQGENVVLSNTQLSSVTVTIPDKTVVKAPAIWDGVITPPKTITTTGIIQSGFQTPTTSISVGSPDVVLVFDSSVTLILTGTTGQTAYKLPGATQWILIDTCTGTFASPDDPPANGECSITDGTDTKILTFHFTEFAGISVTPVSTPSTSTSIQSSSGGGGSRTGVGPSGSSSGFAGKISKDIVVINIIPTWFKTNVISWWYLGLMNDIDIKSSITYMLDKKIIDIQLDDKPPKPLMDLAPSVKHIFNMWSSGSLDDAAIIDIITYYRIGGVW